MYPVSASFLSALRYAHTAVVQVDAWRDGTRVATALAIAGGDVTIDTGSAVRRTLNLTVAPQPGLYDLLAPTGTELRPKRGVRFPNGQTEWVPLGRFDVDVQKLGYAPSGALTFTAPDRWVRVQRAQFETPARSTPAATVRAEIARLVTEAVPGVTIHDTATSTAVLRQVVWQRDRAAAVTDMGKAIGAEIFFDADGDLVIRNVATLAGITVWTVDASESGVLLNADRERNRQRTANVVVASSSATDGTALFDPVVVADTDPTSPTWVGGAFGRVPDFLVSPLFVDAPGATVAALARLEQVRGLAAQLTLESTVNPALDGGDTIDALLPNEGPGMARPLEHHLIDRVVVPLTIAGSQSIATRSSRPDES